MNNRECLDMAAQVIAQVGRGQRADDVLRRAFPRRAHADSELRRAVSLRVFEYFRWKGLVDRKKPLPNRMRETEELARQFGEDPMSFTAETLGRAVPEWLSDQMAIPVDWLRSIQCLPRLWIRAQTKNVGQVEAGLGDLVRPSQAPGLGAFEYCGSLDLFNSPEFKGGLFEIQDLSSQWVGSLCDPKPGETWWDACAGEGGKFLDLADRMNNRGMIWVTDRSNRRLTRLKQRAARASVFNYRRKLANLVKGAPFKVRFDGVLVDAPCSGVGTWQRNPDARWTTSSQDVSELAIIQKKLLAIAAKQIKPGGKLVYAVCTLTRSETVEVANWFEREEPGFEPLSLDVVGMKTPDEWPARDSWCWLGGSSGEGNGMFVAAWRRR